jgi:hypothetical protein
LPGLTGNLAYDPLRERFVAFAGGQTWEYGPSDPAAFSSFGTGCPGSAGTPAISALPGRGPWIADSLALELTRIPAGTVALGLVGVSKTRWGPIVLPLGLAGAGMPGCVLHVSGELLLPWPVSGATGTLVVPIPNERALVGAGFHAQAFVYDPQVNVAGVTASNAGEGRIGAR